MKYAITIALFLASILFQPAFGQISLKFSAGLNRSNCKFGPFAVITQKARTGYFFGLTPAYQINHTVHVQMGFQYSQKGYRIEAQKTYPPFEYRYTYLDILPEIDFSLLKSVSLGIGVNYGIKLNEQVKNDNGEWLHPYLIETIRSTDFGLTGKLEVNHKSIFGFIRYNIGVINISNNIEIRDISGKKIGLLKQLNRNLQIGVGYKLDFKKKK